MKKRREESDGRTVPEGRRKPVPTVARRGGRATTASQEADQLELFVETADSPQGAGGDDLTGQPARKRRSVPKSTNTARAELPTMSYFADRGLLSLEQHYCEMHRVVVPAQLCLDLG
jgi:hypothetical protein